MEFRPEETANFLAYFETIKHKIEGMPGLITLKIYQDANNKNIVFTHSTWLNQSSLDEYRGSDLFGKVWPFTKSLFKTKPAAWSLKLK